MKKITLLIIFTIIGIFSLAQNTVLNFDGTTSPQYVETSTMIPLTTTFTVMGWVDINAAQTQIFTWGSSSINNYIQIKTSWDSKLEVYAPSGVLSFKSTTVISGSWHHVSVTNNAGSFKIYIDGVEEASTTGDLSSISPTQTSVGSALLNGVYQGAGNFDIDELSIWNVALSSAQIATYKNTPPTGSESGLVAAYDFNPAGVTPGGDNTAITALADLAGNYPATLTGFQLTGSVGNYITSTNTTLGLNEIELKNMISFSPNPASNYIKIKGVNSQTNYSIYNLLGSRVLKGSVNAGATIDINPLNKGLYILTLDNNQSYKFIKN